MKKRVEKEVEILDDVNHCDDDGARASHYDENDVYQNIDEEDENDELIVVSEKDEKKYQDMQLEEIISKIILNDKSREEEKNKINPSKNSHRYDNKIEKEDGDNTDLDEELDENDDYEEELELDEEDNYFDDFSAELKGKKNEKSILAKMDRMKKIEPENDEYENEFDEISGEKEKKIIEVELDLLGKFLYFPIAFFFSFLLFSSLLFSSLLFSSAVLFIVSYHHYYYHHYHYNHH